MKTTTNNARNNKNCCFRNPANLTTLTRRGFQHLPPMEFAYSPIENSTIFNNRYEKLRDVNPVHHSPKTQTNCNVLAAKCAMATALGPQPCNRPNRIILQLVSLKQAFLNFDF
jgi:hypothetical protein